MTPLCFLDCETDGVHPGRKPWEIAMIRCDDTGERETSFFVEIDLATADPFGLRVGRFYDRHPLGRWVSGLEGGAHPPEFFADPADLDENYPDGGYLEVSAAAEQVARFTHGAHIVGAVPNFDTETLDRLLREHWLAPSWHYHLVDVEALAVGYLAGKGEPVRPPWKSDDLSVAIGVESPSEDERHTALGDARWAMRIYDAITGAAE